VIVGESGDSGGMGLLVATSSLAGECVQAERSRVRDDSHEVVLLLFDEEIDDSHGDQDSNCETNLNPQYFLDKVPNGDLFFEFLHDNYNDCGCLNNAYIHKAESLRWFIDKTGDIHIDD
jgi:hypothetical protein